MAKAKKATVEFKVGDRVFWTSSYTEKEGKVVKIVKAGEAPGGVIRELVKELKAVDMYGGGMARAAKSYVVMVEFPGTRRKPRLYWPSVTQLRPVEDGQHDDRAP